jgi:acetoin utilization protein AcuB
MSMNKPVPTVMKFMTVMPHSVGFDQTIDMAHKMMNENSIRHLPVMKAGQISGIVSDRDLKLAMSIRGVEANKTTVDEVASSEVFLVKPDSKLDDVAKMMAEKKIGSVLVVDNHRLVGIFTTTDALKALNELLHSRLTH